MACKSCPHHVRHGQVAADGKNIQFSDRCALLLRREIKKECQHVPFDARFDYTECDVYVETFKTSGLRNNCVPTSDIQYSDKLAGSSITEMELL